MKTTVMTVLELADGTRLPVHAAEMDSEIERVRSDRAVKPDLRWSATDSHGHVHRWDQTGAESTLPTLRSERRDVPCDGSCGGTCGGEGYTATFYLCVNCGDEVEPGFIPDTFVRDVGLAVKETVHYTVTLAAEMPSVTGSTPLEGAHLVRGSERLALPPLYFTSVDMGTVDDMPRWKFVGTEWRSVPREQAGSSM